MNRSFPSGVVLLCAAIFLCAGCSTSQDSAKKRSEDPSLSGPFLGRTPPGATPELFAPGVISTGLYERDVAMTPDGNELYFGLISGRTIAIAMLRQVNGVWTRPEIAPFSGDPGIFDLEPHITPDGKRLLFLSTRPQEGQTPQIGWAYQDIWAMDRTGNGWGAPYNLGPPVNSDAHEYFPSVTLDGTIYFTRETTANGRRQSLILRSRLVNGTHAEPEILPQEVNPGDQQFNAFIDPGERYIIVSISGRPDNIGRADYYVSFRNADDSWTGPINMGALVNTPGNTVTSPYVSPDGRYFFFASSRTQQDQSKQKLDYETIQDMATKPQNGNADIYWVDASFIETLRTQPAQPGAGQ